MEPAMATRLLKAEQVGRPVGDLNWMRGLEAAVGPNLSPRKPGESQRLGRTDHKAWRNWGIDILSPNNVE